MPEDREQTALTLNGKKKNIRKKDFLAFADNCGNMPPRNFEEWYETFGVTKKDKMYIAPSKRLIIW